MAMQTLPRVTEEDKRAYREDGVVCRRGMFDGGWIDRISTMLIPGDPGLPAGTPLTGDLFPVVWRRGSGNVA